jgi:hypothetical protein
LLLNRFFWVSCVEVEADFEKDQRNPFRDVSFDVDFGESSPL